MKSLFKTSFRAVASARAISVGSKWAPTIVRSFAIAKKEADAPLSLTEALTQEIAHEAGEQEIDQEYLDAKKSITKHFTLKDEPTNGVVELLRKHDNETVTVRFDCQNVDDSQQDGEYAGEVDDEDEEGEGGSSFGINFEVEVVKGEETLIFDCVASESLHIKNVQFYPAGKKPQDPEDRTYAGPPFEDLEPAVQEAFIDYLQERKIDEDLSYFVMAHSREKEQNEYVNWLNNIVNFAAKK